MNQRNNPHEQFLRRSCMIGPQLLHSQGESCSICTEPMHSETTINYKPPGVFVNNCGHWFHNQCIHPWSKIGNTTPKCPICREPLVFDANDRQRAELGKLEKRKREAPSIDDDDLFSQENQARDRAALEAFRRRGRGAIERDDDLDRLNERTDAI